MHILLLSKCSLYTIFTGYDYAELSNRHYCYCDNNYRQNDAIPESECSEPCAGDSGEKCGGTWSSSVYKTGSGNVLYTLNYGLIYICVYKSHCRR